MARALLIHGYAVGLDSLFRPPHNVDGGFSGFRPYLTSGEAVLFHWPIPAQAPGLKSLDPATYLGLYSREEQRAQDREVQARLTMLLWRESPEVIVCHSLGCRLLLAWLHRQELPPSVRRIVWMQADVDADTTLPEQIVSGLRSGRLAFEHFWCPWDPSLLASCLIHGKLRAGMTPLRDAASNFRPLLRPINLHTSLMRSTEFAQEVIGTDR